MDHVPYTVQHYLESLKERDLCTRNEYGKNRDTALSALVPHLRNCPRPRGCCGGTVLVLYELAELKGFQE